MRARTNYFQYLHSTIQSTQHLSTIWEKQNYYIKWMCKLILRYSYIYILQISYRFHRRHCTTCQYPLQTIAIGMPIHTIDYLAVWLAVCNYYVKYINTSILLSQFIRVRFNIAFYSAHAHWARGVYTDEACKLTRWSGLMYWNRIHIRWTIV